MELNQVKELVIRARETNKLELAIDVLLDCLDQAETYAQNQSRTIKRLEKQVSDYGWQTNPDRMGGAFSEDEKSDTGWK